MENAFQMAGALPQCRTPMIIKLQRLKQETSLGLCISVAIIIKAAVLFSAEFVALKNFEAEFTADLLHMTYTAFSLSPTRCLSRALVDTKHHLNTCYVNGRVGDSSYLNLLPFNVYLLRICTKLS